MSTTLTICIDNEWHIQEIRKTVANADKPDAKFVKHEDVASWLRSWGTDKEQTTRSDIRSVS